MNLHGSTPLDFGIVNPKFASFRREQIEALDWLMESDKFMSGGCLPPGIGKSLIAVVLARATGMRTAILTATKGLQDQYKTDFESSGLVDIRGKANYQCTATMNCRSGALDGCGLVGTGECEYEAARDVAREADVLCTNYAYWIQVNRTMRGLEKKVDEREGEMPNPVELLVLDEGHLAAEQLAQALKIHISESWLQAANLKLGEDYDVSAEWTQSVEYWAAWASGMQKFLKQVQDEAGRALGKAKQVGGYGLIQSAKNRCLQLEALVDSVEAMSQMKEDEWICTMTPGTRSGRIWEFELCWPGSNVHRLWCGVKRVVALSASLKPIALQLLNVKKEDREFREWNRVFPANKTPIVYVPCKRADGVLANISHKAKQEDLDAWVELHDRIVEPRLNLGRKGITMTVSYARQKYLLEHSRLADRFVVNRGQDDLDAVQAAEKYRAAKGGVQLVSPSYSTGWDFPADECRLIVIAKIPIRDVRGAVMQARLKHNAHYADNLAVQDFIQGTHRGTRFMEDWCEVFVIDNYVKSFYWRNRGLFANWFSFFTLVEVPKPMRPH